MISYKLELPKRSTWVLHMMDSLYHFHEHGNMEHDRMLWNLAMQKLSEKEGDVVKAFDYNKKYLHLRDSIDLVTKKSVARDMGRELENREQRAANFSLEKQNEKTAIK